MWVCPLFCLHFSPSFYNISRMNKLLNTLSKDGWKKIGTEKRAGVLAPLFSVYSKESVGIGDFADMGLVVDWCTATGNSILQLLPMNEVGSTFCPYDAVSSFALEPVYISLNSIPAASRVRAKIETLKKKFPIKSHIDYGVREEKLVLLREIFSKNADADSADFKKFIKENSYWLDDFALYKVLKGHHKGLPWYDWKNEFMKRDKESLEVFEKEHISEVLFQKWVQWVLSNQFRDAKAYAGQKGVLICGDLPILTSRDSADVWAHPEFFKLEFAAGAPPDMYCAKGQRWGMPTYNWKAIAADGYRYLKEKLKYAENFYEMLRIDHVVGLFRIWSIPYNDPPENEGLNGVFDPAEEKQWEAHGKGLLSVILESTGMLLAAEDLGMIPKECPRTLKELGIPGNDVQRWTKDWDVRHDFLRPEEYRPIAISMLSTHDTTNWPGWWENEAGTVDEALFIRRCAERLINYEYVRPKLFDSGRSRHGRLRWLESVKSVEDYINILGKKEEELRDFIEFYQNTYLEKEKLWKGLGLSGPMREKSDPDISAAALGITLKSKSIFCINLLIDYLYTCDILKGDPYQYRINRPGAISKRNWSLTIPISLENLITHAVSKKIAALISAMRKED
jgi:4-alpha-glucanotransferase